MSLYIGLMSGTSMDAVDAVLVDITSDTEIRVQHSCSTAIPQPLARSLRAALETTKLTALELWRIDAAVGTLFADAALELLHDCATDAGDVVAIGSHGQTLYHAPRASPPVTVQVGDPNVIAWRTGITTVADLRRMDLAAGGQGAPLAPAFHTAAFARDGEPQAVLNVGGIANLTVLSGNSSIPTGGFDTGPGNTLMDAWAREQIGRDFDEDGAWAATGQAAPVLLERLLQDPYFSRSPPKSTGREYFSLRWLEGKLHDHQGLGPADVQRTLCELTAHTVADAIRDHAASAGTLLLCGGGALNMALVSALKLQLPQMSLCSTAERGIPPRSVEGAAFAWLAQRTLNGRPGNLPTVTGAARAAVLGAIYQP